jgi:hypothetical protein
MMLVKSTVYRRAHGKKIVVGSVHDNNSSGGGGTDSTHIQHNNKRESFVRSGEYW